MSSALGIAATEKLRIERVAVELERFVRTHFDVDPSDTRLGRDTLLWEEGYLDSTGAVEVIAFLEQRFAIALPEEMLFDPEFTSIGGIARSVAKLVRGTGA